MKNKLVMSVLLCSTFFSMAKAGEIEKVFEVFNCSVPGTSLKLDLVSGTGKEVRISLMGFEKNYQLSQNPVFRKAEVVNGSIGVETRRVDATQIVLSNPDRNFYDHEYYSLNLDGNLLEKSITTKAKGTIKKTIITYGTIGYRVPITSPEMPVECEIKIQ